MQTTKEDIASTVEVRNYTVINLHLYIIKVLISGSIELILKQ